MTDITIISGFLGAGKTTFANLLLDYYIRSGDTTAYIVNEFGQTSLDAALLEKKGFTTVDIFGGCICCTLRGKIKDALKEVITQYKPSRIVFEPSGVFVFDKFLEILEDEFLEQNCRVDSVVTIVDSTHTPNAMLVEGNFFSNQIVHADTIILSKLEIYKGDVDALSNKLSLLNERADIVKKLWSEFDDEDFANLTRGGSKNIDADEEHAHGHAHVDTMSITPKELTDKDIDELKKLIKEGFFGDVYRIKGKVLYNGEVKVLQAAFDSINLDDNPPDGDFGLTFIGNALNENKIKEFWA